MSCHGYEGVMSVLCTPLQVKRYHLYLLCACVKCYTHTHTNSRKWQETFKEKGEDFRVEHVSSQFELAWTFEINTSRTCPLRHSLVVLFYTFNTKTNIAPHLSSLFLACWRFHLRKLCFSQLCYDVMLVVSQCSPPLLSSSSCCRQDYYFLSPVLSLSLCVFTVPPQLSDPHSIHPARNQLRQAET